jgi:HAD superfamily hydrolase (TIGR01450 family)
MKHRRRPTLLMTEALIAHYDAALFDLDGVVYLGPQPVEGAVDTLTTLRDTGVIVALVTNNAARSPEDIAAQLNRMGIASGPEDVVVSSQAIARLMAAELPAGARVLVVGNDNLAAEIQRADMVPVTSHLDKPDAVVQGYHPGLPWSLMDEAALAIAAGAKWYASNEDATRPTDIGELPGAGAQGAVLKTCFPGQLPVVAGKPYPPLLNETVSRTGAQHPIFVGDRLDTDIEGAHNVDMDSLFVFTGAHGKADLSVAPPTQRPTHIGYSVAALVAPPRRLQLTQDVAHCNKQQVWRSGNEFQLVTKAYDTESQLDALWAGLNLAWLNELPLNSEFLDKLDILP